ncbi:PhzF family phenazine biosynthesis protein [Pseudoduganella violaceinigra]|uniref:PhzF family phenazine biosynthesis protein n=1 Tax=Pseudoduganella violaceinigra TaxID=246602 RepID=UPI000428C1D2|nr:PhzF family phenazine biosynthesis protein [Pseudoduganella violaceinigra]
MTIYELNCFGTRPGAGNPALVILGGIRAEDRQAFAKAANKSASVFVDPGTGGASWTLDYFYPHTRSPLCLHATLAAARVLLADAPGPITVRSAMRGQELVLTRSATGAFISLARQPAPDAAAPADLAERLLAAPGLPLVSAPAVASVGSPKLLVEVADSATLQSLRPNLAAIFEWGQEHGVNGIYAWCRRPDGAFEGRNFNHLDPAKEDSATGVAAGALTLHLGRSLDLYQGAQLGQPCLLRTQLDGAHIQIGGAADYV